MKTVQSDFQWTNADGTPTQYFYELVKEIESRTFKQKVSTTAPTNGQVLTFNSSNGLWVPGAN
jgi:hypothetical protein